MPLTFKNYLWFGVENQKLEGVNITCQNPDEEKEKLVQENSKSGHNSQNSQQANDKTPRKTFVNNNQKTKSVTHLED